MTTHCGCSGKDLLDLAIQTLKPKEFESDTPYFSNVPFIISMGRNSEQNVSGLAALGSRPCCLSEGDTGPLASSNSDLPSGL